MFRDRALVVGAPRAVRGPDLDEVRTGLREDVGHAEPAADLDELAARHEHLAFACQRREHEQHRGRVVVDDETGFGPAREREERGTVILARAAPARIEPEFDVRVATRFGHRGPGRRAERRPAEIRVQEHARRVHDRAEQRRPRGVDACVRVGDDGVEPDRGMAAFAGPAAGVGHGPAGAFGDDGARHAAGAGVRELLEHPLDARYRPPGVHGRSVGRKGSPPRPRRLTS